MVVFRLSIVVAINYFDDIRYLIMQYYNTIHKHHVKIKK